MAKRFHSGRTEEKHESARKAKASRHHEYAMRNREVDGMREHYAGREQSNAEMRRDANMINDDWSAPCLLPQRVIDRDWPRSPNYHLGHIDDLFSGAQHQLNEDHKDLDNIAVPKKY
jgi:hypothetical protein